MKPKTLSSPRMIHRRVNGTFVTRAVSFVGVVIAVIALIVSYYSYQNTKDFNSFQKNQGKPILDFAGFNDESLADETFTSMSAQKSRLCDYFYFTLTNINEHPANNIRIDSTVVQHDAGSNLVGYQFTDKLGNFDLEKDKQIKTASRSFCYYLVDEANTNLQSDNLWWHALVSYTDALTGSTYSQNIYEEVSIEYNKSQNQWSDNDYISSMNEFQKKIDATSTITPQK